MVIMDFVGGCDKGGKRVNEGEGGYVQLMDCDL